MPDLAAREESALEWWFFQGRLEGAELGRREFMLSLFRQRGQGNSGDGHMLLASTLDPESGRQRVTSQVSPQLIDNFLREMPQEARALNFDGHVVDAFVQEIANGGPPAPIRLEEAAVETAALPFSLRWNGTRIAASEGEFELAFTLPEEGVACVLRARPEAGWLTGRELERDVPTMDYDCCPRLAIEGMAGGEAVSGQVWFDHQWGEYGWLRGAKPGEALLRWIWFGISLDDGSEVLITVRSDGESGAPVSSFCVFFDRGAEPLITHDVRLAERRRWQSDASLAEYPVAWDIKLPELGLDLAFEPRSDNQEIPVFGLMNAIWQGAGTVAGTRNGKAVRGPARLELQGFAYVHEFDAVARRWGERVGRHLAAFLPRRLDDAKLTEWAGAPRWSYDAAAQTEMLSKPVWDLLERGGKHWRPVFGLFLLDALGGDRPRFEALMAVVPELIHNASLIIDDIEDGSQTRRGAPSIHRRYGLERAINAANTLYFLPLQEIANQDGLSAEQRDAIYAVVIRMFTQAHLGQAQDLYWSGMAAADRARLTGERKTGGLILQTHAFKSAAAVTAIAEIACIVAGASEEVRRAALRLAESWGTAFQMVDDVNNFAASPDWGKVRGEDVHEGKVTYPIHLAMQMLEGGRRRRLATILADDETRRSAAGLEEAIALIEQSGALDRCRAEARRLLEADWPAFSAALPQTHAKLMLRAMLSSLIDLRFET